MGESNVNGNRYGQLAALLCAAALFLAGCGGGGSGISQDAHDTLQMDFDAAVAELAASQAEVTRLEGELETSQASVARLRVELTTANGSVTSLTSDLSDANDDVDSLTTRLATANASVTSLTNQIGSADDPTSLQGLLAAERARVTNLTSQLATARTEATSLRAQLTTAQNRATTLQTELDDAEVLVATLQGQVTTERTRATQAELDAQEEIAEAQAEIAQQNQTAEARQRAQYLQAEMHRSYMVAAPPLGTDVTMDVPSRGRLELTRPGTSWRLATLGGSGLRSTTMALTSSVNTGKTVVYTDRELSRPLLEHFGSLRDPDNRNLLEFTTTPDVFNFEMVDEDGESTDGMVATSVGQTEAWQLTLPRGSLPNGIPKVVSQIPDPGTPGEFMDPPGLTAARMADSYPVSLFGMSGQLVCPGCQVSLTPTYNADADVPVATARGQHDLASVAVTSSNTQVTDLRFDPSGSPSVHFYNGADFLGDYEYMVFGYWREDPESPASPYDDGAIGVFAQAFDGTGSLTVPDPIEATYRGTAVGMYVEQELSDPIDTHRQGEFVANAILTVDGAPASITGTIRDFAVTPTAGSAMPERHERWVVRLLDKVTNPTDSIVLNNESGGTAGGWDHDYVQAHAYAGRDSDQSDPDRSVPPGVTGTFNARIGTITRTDQQTNTIDTDALHIIGAFGAHQ